VSLILIAVYMANLVYTLVTNRGEFEEVGEAVPAQWPVWTSLFVLILGTVLTALEAELISDVLTQTAAELGLSVFFLGIVVLAVIGNASEYIAAIYFARQGQMGMVMSITVGSTIQMALLMAPMLVLISYFMGTPMNLVFSNPLELIAVAGVAFTVNAIAEDGMTTWFEGVLLVAVYLILGLAFLFVTP
jgi:Ca2+:H+ antiporter